MPLFFFHVYDDETAIDVVGTDIPDSPTARLEAVRLAGQILADDPEKVLSAKAWSMEVTDLAGRIFFRLDFYLSIPTMVADPLMKVH